MLLMQERRSASGALDSCSPEVCRQKAPGLFEKKTQIIGLMGEKCVAGWTHWPLVAEQRSELRWVLRAVKALQMCALLNAPEAPEAWGKPWRCTCPLYIQYTLRQRELFIWAHHQRSALHMEVGSTITSDERYSQISLQYSLGFKCKKDSVLLNLKPVVCVVFAFDFNSGSDPII